MHLPLIELRRVVRFVEVTQSINGTLVNESVRRLQLADRVSHALAAGLADGAEVGRLMTILAAEVHADATLTAPNGEVIAEARADWPTSPSTRAQDHPIVAPVSSAGVTVALLTLSPAPGADLLLLDAARDRAPEALGLALLRSRPSVPARARRPRAPRPGRVGWALPTPVRSSSPPGSGSTPTTRGCARWPRIGPGQGLTAGIEAAVSRGGRDGDQPDRPRLLPVRHRPAAGRQRPSRRSEPASSRTCVTSRCPPQVKVAVGPGTRVLTGIGHCLAEAASALDLTEDSGEGVVDAVALGVPRFLGSLGRPQLVADFVEEQLGDLLEIDRRRKGQLFETLASTCGTPAHKTDTAAALHLQRQSLYQRLDRIMVALGHPVPGSSRWGALTLAVELEVARRRSRTQAEGGWHAVPRPPDDPLRPPPGGQMTPTTTERPGLAGPGSRAGTDRLVRRRHTDRGCARSPGRGAGGGTEPAGPGRERDPSR